MKKRTTEELHRLSQEEYEQTPKLPFRAVLDNVRSQHNIGSVFRTCDAFTLSGIDLCGICCCPPNAEIHKTALGAEQTVSWRYFDDTLAAVRQLHEEGYLVYAVEQVFDSLSLEQARYMVAEHKQPIAVVFGHEVFGVQQAVVDACDGCIEIPQYGTKHSLNVSVTAGIVIYELATAFRS